MTPFTASELRARIQKQVEQKDILVARQPRSNMFGVYVNGELFEGGFLTQEDAYRWQEIRFLSFPSLLQSAEDERREKLNLILNHEDIEDARINARLDAQAEYEDRDDGRSDGHGESYAERNL